MRIKQFLAAVLVMITVHGCTFNLRFDSFPRIGERTNPEHSLVFGYFGPGGKATTINWVSIQQHEPFTEDPYLDTGLVYGHFFNPEIPKGSFCVASVAASHSFTSTRFNLNSDFGCFEIDKPGLYYFGSYEVFIAGKNAELKTLKQPDEEAVIKKILNYTDKNTYWEKELLKRLDKLKDIKARKAKIPRAI